MKVQTIIVTYNGEDYIRECLSSLMAYVKSSDVIVIDNASTDNTTPIIKSEFPDAKLVLLEGNIGFGQANNIGMEIALRSDSDYMFLLNQDAYVDANSVEKLVQVLSENMEYGIISPLHLAGDGSCLDPGFTKYLGDQEGIELLRYMYMGNYKRDIYEVSFVNAAAWMLKRECVLNVGGFSPLFFHYGEDNEYVNRLHYHGFKIGITPNATIRHDRKVAYERNVRRMKYEKEIRNRINLLDPKKKRSISIQRRVLLYSLIKNLLKFNFRKLFLSVNQFIKLLRLQNELNRHRKKIIEKGATYLNHSSQ